MKRTRRKMSKKTFQRNPLEEINKSLNTMEKVATALINHFPPNGLPDDEKIGLEIVGKIMHHLPEEAKTELPLEIFTNYKGQKNHFNNTIKIIGIKLAETNILRIQRILTTNRDNPTEMYLSILNTLQNIYEFAKQNNKNGWQEFCLIHAKNILENVKFDITVTENSSEQKLSIIKFLTSDTSFASDLSKELGLEQERIKDIAGLTHFPDNLAKASERLKNQIVKNQTAIKKKNSTGFMKKIAKSAFGDYGPNVKFVETQTKLLIEAYELLQQYLAYYPKTTILYEKINIINDFMHRGIETLKELRKDLIDNYCPFHESNMHGCSKKYWELIKQWIREGKSDPLVYLPGLESNTEKGINKSVLNPWNHWDVPNENHDARTITDICMQFGFIENKEKKIVRTTELLAKSLTKAIKSSKASVLIFSKDFFDKTSNMVAKEIEYIDMMLESWGKNNNKTTQSAFYKGRHKEGKNLSREKLVDEKIYLLRCKTALDAMKQNESITQDQLDSVKELPGCEKIVYFNIRSQLVI